MRAVVRSGEVTAGLDCLGEAMRILVDCCEKDRTIKSDEWFNALCHCLVNYFQLGGIDLLFHYSKIVVGRLAVYPSRELHELDLDLGEVLRIIGAVTFRLSSYGKVSEIVVLGRAVNYLVGLQEEPADAEGMMLCMSSSILTGCLFVNAGQMDEAEESFNNALAYCVKIENSGQDCDPEYHFQCYVLGLDIYLSKGMYGNVEKILETKRKQEERLSELGMVMGSVQARYFLLAEIAMDRRNGKFHAALRKAVRVCRNNRVDCAGGAEAPPCLVALGHSEMARALYHLGRLRSSMIWVDSSLRLLRRAAMESGGIQEDEQLIVAYRLLEVLTGLTHRNYPGSLKRMHSVSGDLIRLFGKLEEDRGFARDRQLWSDKLLVLENACVLSGFDLVACEPTLPSSSLEALLARWETQLSSKIHEFWLESREIEGLSSDPLLLRYRRLKHAEAISEMTLRSSGRSSAELKELLAERPIAKEMRIGKWRRDGARSPVCDSEPTVPLDQQIRELLEEIRKLNPSFGTGGEFDTGDLQKVRGGLKDDECIVIPVYCVINAHFVVVCQTRLRMFSMCDYDYRNLLTFIVRYQELVGFLPNFAELVEAGPGQKFDDVARTAEEIIGPIHDCFRDVLARVGEYLGGLKKRVFLLHDANLACFAYHAMPLSGNHLFGDEFDVSYIPNLRVLDSIAREVTSFADNVVISGAGSGALEFCTIEERLVWRAAHNVSCGNRSRSEVMEEIGNAGIFHYCGHVGVNPDKPLGSSILIGESHMLTVENLLNGLRLSKCRIVILNGCGSAIYRRSAPPDWRQIDSPFYGVENEPVSFSTAFLVAGARSTLTTLWPVWDLAACVFIWKFCSLMESGVDICIALRHAMRWMRSDICDGKCLVSKVLPEMISSLESAKDRRLLGKRLKEHARKYKNSPPFGHYSYWAGYIISGVPW